VGQQLSTRAGSRLVDEELRQKGYRDILSTGKMESDLRMIMDNVTLLIVGALVTWAIYTQGQLLL